VFGDEGPAPAAVPGTVHEDDRRNKVHDCLSIARSPTRDSPGTASHTVGTVSATFVPSGRFPVTSGRTASPRTDAHGERRRSCRWASTANTEHDSVPGSTRSWNSACPTTATSPTAHKPAVPDRRGPRVPAEHPADLAGSRSRRPVPDIPGTASAHETPAQCPEGPALDSRRVNTATGQADGDCAAVRRSDGAAFWMSRSEATDCYQFFTRSDDCRRLVERQTFPTVDNRGEEPMWSRR
jgi:hypothetical protein